MADRRCILVVEDDPALRFNLASYLLDSGFDVIEEDSGSRGIEIARSEPIDLVLCDLRIPGIDGLDVLQTLHAEIPELPVVVISGTGVLSDAVEALRKGAWDFLVKPILDMAMLDHAITGALEKARLIRENRRYQTELEQVNRSLRELLDRYEQDAAAGRSLQQQMLPPEERWLGAYRFTRELLPSLSLSGDFVDYFMLDADRFGFYIADVSGHGVSSAFVTVLVKSFMRRYLEQLEEDGDRTILDPAATLARLNRDLLGQHLDKYLTMFYGVIDVMTNRLVCSNAGHFPYPVLFDGESARFIEEKGPPVGLFPKPAFSNRDIELPSAHALLLFSDGVFDAMPGATLEEKRERLLAAVNACSAELEADRIIAALGLSRTGGYPDDITLLTVQREV